VTRIYIVEDDRDLLLFLMRALQSEAEVEGFERGDEALVALRREPPDVLLCDLNLPGLSGETLAAEMGRLAPAGRVLLMSADGERLRRAKPLADGILPKPFAMPEVFAALRMRAD
jgi:DNA-binding response OmpR family regulator